MTQTTLKPIVLSILLISSPILAQAHETEQTVDLETVNVVGKSHPRATSGLLHTSTASDKIISGDTLRQKAVNLGDALNGVPGVHASQYGGGASAPVIRGQTGRRIKVLNHHGETGDMADFSPDHALMVDTALSQQVEILRGPVTLLYSSGNVAGLVDVADGKIPEKMPENGVSGELGLRLSSGNLEKLTSGGINVGLGKNFVLHTEGLYRKSGDYAVPRYRKEEGRLKRLPDSHADSQTGSIGLSWVGEKGFIGAAYSDRRDQYGLPAHSHLYDDCHADIIWQKSLINKRYLQLYPHLLTEEDIDYDNPGLSCGFHDDDNAHAHTHSGRPWIDLRNKRYELRAEWKQPLPGFEALRVHLNRNNYRHDEKAGDAVENFFKNKTQNARIELRHLPIGRLKGSWGVQYLTQQSSALSAIPETVQQPMLIDNDVHHYSFFGVEQANWDNFSLEGGVRVEKQKAAIQYDKALIDRENYYNQPLPDLGAHRQTARSFALSGNWYFTPRHKLSLTASHQERLPSTQELYAHGKHVATNTFEVGNKSIEDDSEMKLVRYNQSGADFYGAEGEIYFKPTPRYRIGLSGDYVRGRLKNLPSLPGREDAYGNRPLIAQADQNAPRVPAARLGFHLNAALTDRIDAHLDYYRVFAQNKLARYETRTPGHHMLNLGANYRRRTRYGEWNWYVKADNLFNQSVYAHSSFLSDTPQMGRSFTGGVNFKF